MSQPVRDLVQAPPDMDISEVNEIVRAMSNSKADKTIKDYSAAWERFRAWCEKEGKKALPASEWTVAGWLISRSKERCGRGPGGTMSPGTLEGELRGVRHMHEVFGQPSPTLHPIVRRTMAGLRQKLRRPMVQARGLTAERFAKVVQTAGQRRVFTVERRGGTFTRTETAKTAAKRARRDLALIGTMRDALLRRAEAAALLWHHVQYLDDGTGRLVIMRSKTNPEPVTRPLRAQTVAYLKAYQGSAKPQDRVFPFSTFSISNMIRKACSHAGLGDDFSGHSCRVGMAQDLLKSGATVAEIMYAGRWSDPMMVGRYTAGIAASESAVAKAILPDYAGTRTPDP